MGTPEQPRRPFRRPWTVAEREESFVILDADGHELMKIYFNDRDRNRPEWLSKDEARRLVRPARRLPELVEIERRMKAGGNFDQGEGE